MISLEDANKEYRFTIHSDLKGGRIQLVLIWSSDGFNEKDIKDKLKNCTDNKVRLRLQQLLNQIQIATILRERLEK